MLTEEKLDEVGAVAEIFQKKTLPDMHSKLVCLHYRLKMQ
jgi:hypothetical protein